MHPMPLLFIGQQYRKVRNEVRMESAEISYAGGILGVSSL